MSKQSLTRAHEKLFGELKSVCPEGLIFVQRPDLPGYTKDLILQTADFVLFNAESIGILVVQLDDKYDRSRERIRSDLDIDQAILSRSIPVVRFGASERISAKTLKKLIDKSQGDANYLMLDCRAKFEERLNAYGIRFENVSSIPSKQNLKNLLIKLGVLFIFTTTLVASAPTIFDSVRREVWFIDLLEKSEFLRDIFGSPEMKQRFLELKQEELRELILEKQPWLADAIEQAKIKAAEVKDQIIETESTNQMLSAGVPMIDNQEQMQKALEGASNTLRGIIEGNASANPIRSAAKDGTKILKDTIRDAQGIDRNIETTTSAQAKSNKDSKGCEIYSSPRGEVLVKNQSEVRQGYHQAKWKLNNTSTQTVAVTIVQDNKDLAVIYMGPFQIFETNIPGTHLRFKVKSTKNTCLDWANLPSIQGSFPFYATTTNGAQEDLDYYSKSIFETEIKNPPQGQKTLDIRTKRVGTLD